MTDIDELMTDAGVLMDLLRIVTEVKKPIQIGVGAKEWVIDLPNKKIAKGKAANPEVSISLEEADFLALQTGKLNPMQAFMQGKIKAKGNLGVLMKLQPLQAKVEKIRDKQTKKAKL